MLADVTEYTTAGVIGTAPESGDSSSGRGVGIGVGVAAAVVILGACHARAVVVLTMPRLSGYAVISCTRVCACMLCIPVITNTVP